MPAPTRLSHTPSATRAALGIAVVAVLATIASLVGSTAAAAPAAPAKSVLSGRTFISDTVSGNNPLPGGGPITMKFGKSNQISLNAGCNQLNSTVDLAKNRFTVKQPMASTRRACPNGADQWITGFLKSKPGWRLTDADLVLSNGDVRVRLVDRKEAADRPLIGTRWTVTGLIDKGAVVATPSPAKSAPTLRFSNFQVSGSTGCNSFSGPAVPVTSMIVFGPVSTSRKACTDPAKRQAEKSLLKALTGLKNWVVDGKTLTVVSSEGVGFVARTDR